MESTSLLFLQQDHHSRCSTKIQVDLPTQVLYLPSLFVRVRERNLSAEHESGYIHVHTEERGMITYISQAGYWQLKRI